MLEHVLGLQYLLKLQRVKQTLIKNQNWGMPFNLPEQIASAQLEVKCP